MTARVADAARLATIEDETSYEDTAVNPGVIYFYWVRAVTRYGTGEASASAFGYRARVVGEVVLDATGGTAGAASVAYTAGNPYGTLPTAVRTGCDFAGWWTAATGGGEVTAETVADERVATLYAHWTPHAYTIRFDPNGGAGEMADLAMTYDVARALPGCGYTRAGYVFTGWARGADATSASLPDGATVSNLSDDDGAIVTLYAVWGLSAPKNVSCGFNGYYANGVVVKKFGMNWDAAEGAVEYRIYRSRTDDFAEAELVAATTETGYSEVVERFPYGYHYWVVADNGSFTAASESVRPIVDMLPLMNLLNSMDSRPRNTLIDDDEITVALTNPNKADLDGDTSSVSASESAIFNRIKAVNAIDPTILSNTMKGDFSEMDADTLDELTDLSIEIYILTRLRSNYRPVDLSATKDDFPTAKIEVSWSGTDDALSCEVWKSASKDFTATASKIATLKGATSFVDTDVTYRSAYSYKIRAVYANGYDVFSAACAYGYWGDWCHAELQSVDMLPLMNLLNRIEHITPDGYLSDAEINEAINDTAFADIDGNATKNSDAELDVYNRIKALNDDKELLHYVMMGDYTYRGMTRDQMVELQRLSNIIKNLTANR